MSDYICEGYSTRAHEHEWVEVTEMRDVSGSCPATKEEPF